MAYKTLFNLGEQFYKERNNPKYWAEESRTAPFTKVIDNPRAPWDWKVISANLATPNRVTQYSHLPWDFNAISHNYKVTQELVEKFRDKNWDYGQLSDKMPISFIKNNINENWNWKTVSSAVSWNEVEKNPELPWDFKRLSYKFEQKPMEMHNYKDSFYKSNLTPELFRKFIHKDWNWEILSERASWNLVEQNLTRKSKWLGREEDVPWIWKKLTRLVTWKYATEHLDRDWNYKELSYKKAPISEKKALILRFPDKDWFWSYLGLQDDIFRELVHLLPNKPWNWDIILKKKWAWDIINKFPDRDWNWKRISYFHTKFSRLCSTDSWDWWSFDWDFFRKFPNKDWAYRGLSMRRDLNWDIVAEFPEKPWCWGTLSMRKSLMWDAVDKSFSAGWDHEFLRNRKDVPAWFIESHPSYKWNWFRLTRGGRYRGKLWNLVRKYPNKFYDYRHLSHHPGITQEIVDELKEKPWHWSYLETIGIIKSPESVSYSDKSR